MLSWISKMIKGIVIALGFILPGISGGHASDRTVGARHMDEKKK